MTKSTYFKRWKTKLVQNFINGLISKFTKILLGLFDVSYASQDYQINLEIYLKCQINLTKFD